MMYNSQNKMPPEKDDYDATFEKYRELLSGEEPMDCEACGGELSIEKVNLEDYQNGKLYMMEGVPAYVCQACGEVWVPEPIMDEFEKMIKTASHKAQLSPRDLFNGEKNKKRSGKEK